MLRNDSKGGDSMLETITAVTAGVTVAVAKEVLEEIGI